VTSKGKKTKTDPASYRERAYRRIISREGLASFELRVRETDLHILADVGPQEETALQLVLESRSQIENYGAKHPAFFTSLTPLPSDPTAPSIVKEMLKAGTAAGVGPMAAVAGTIAEFVGKGLLAAGASEVIVENGGDIFLSRKRDCTIGIFAGNSPLSNRIGVNIPHSSMPLGICTSSGTVGHSLSFGQADSVTVLAASTALADAAATRLGNEIKKGDDINKGLTAAQTIPDILGVLIIVGERLGAWGKIELVNLG